MDNTRLEALKDECLPLQLLLKSLLISRSFQFPSPRHRPHEHGSTQSPSGPGHALPWLPVPEVFSTMLTFFQSDMELPNKSQHELLLLDPSGFAGKGLSWFRKSC